MAEFPSHEPMLEMFLFETSQLVEQLERLILSCEEGSGFAEDSINEIFRIMHSIKGASAMMLFNQISALAHSMEDLFYLLREEKPRHVDHARLSDLVLEGVDFIKIELLKIRNGDEADGDASLLIGNNQLFLADLRRGEAPAAESGGKIRAEEQPRQQYYISQAKQARQPPFPNAFQATIFFEEGCEMENIRAFTIIHNLNDIAGDISYVPDDIMEHEDSALTIRTQGFQIRFRTDRSYADMQDFFMQTIFLKELKLLQLEAAEADACAAQSRETPERKPSLPGKDKPAAVSGQPSMISVSVSKLDRLMDLVGELVAAEAMVTQNPDLRGLDLGGFQKAARQLRKITGELQDAVMSVRMVPVATAFHKMNRTVRDMCKKLNKEVRLELIGEETEVDKTIIERISDPLMHLIRNSIDHGIETPDSRLAAGKPRSGTVTLEAKNEGSDVLISVKDDGKGMNKERILAKASRIGLLRKPKSEMTEKEIYGLIFEPGFSTTEKVTEFSGRGVGMDVVAKNIEAVGGSVSVDSTPGKGTTVTMKIPLTLAIIDGMNVRVGRSRYTLPIASIRESFRLQDHRKLMDPDGNEMVMVRGQCLPVVRLHELYRVQGASVDMCDGVLIMVEQEGEPLCLFADELLGEQQVVVKALPAYIKSMSKAESLAGCTLLGDGSISLILDVAGLVSTYKRKRISRSEAR